MTPLYLTNSVILSEQHCSINLCPLPERALPGRGAHLGQAVPHLRERHRERERARLGRGAFERAGELIGVPVPDGLGDN